MLNAFASLKCSKKCWHNVQKPTHVRNSLVAADGDLKHGDEQKLEGLI